MASAFFIYVCQHAPQAADNSIYLRFKLKTQQRALT
jgi:hypothetical protein